MTTRNFRVNNGLEVGDIVISASANTITGGATAAPSADGQFANKKYVDDQDAAIASDTLTLTNKTLTAPKFADAGFIADANGNELLIFQTTGSAVNQFDITNNASGSDPIISATGGDTNIGIAITAKGAGDIALNAGADVNIPANKGLTFGDDGEKIEGDGTDLTIASSAKLNLTATTDVILPPNVGLIFDTAGAEKIESDGTDLSISVGSNGDINIPANIGLTFGDDGEKIEGDGTDLTIAGNNINLTAVADIVVPANVGITFGTGEKIEGDSTDLTITSGGALNLTATTDVVVPANVGITFGTGEKIEGDSTDLTVTSGAKINLTAVSDVHIPKNVGIVFDDNASEKIESNDTDLTVTSGADINLTATTDINVPANVGITFGDDAEKIEGDGTDLTITGNNINLSPTADVNIPANKGLTFATAEKIESDGTDLTITVGSSGDINIGANIGMTFGNDGEKIEGDGTDLTIASSAKLNLTATTDVHVPQNVGIVFDANGSEKIESNDTNLTISSGAQIILAPTTDVKLGNSLGVIFGDAGEKIEGDGTDLTISSSNLLNLSATTDIVIPTNVGLHFTDVNEKIESNGTDLTINSGADINLTATADVNIPANVGVTFGDDGEKIEGNGTNLTIASSGTCTVTATGETVVTNNLRVGGNLTVDGTETIINTTTLSVEDNVIEVNRNVSAASGMPTVSGLQINRGEGSTATEMPLLWAWDEAFADDGTTIHGNAGGAFTAFRRAEGGSEGPTGTADLVDIRANVVHAVATSAQYADVAERFEADAPMTAGAVVEVGGDAEITETTSDLSENVFGVISDQPAYAMNAAAGNSESHPYVAMTGRTPVRVTGAVTKGQRLVSSSIKGCARAVASGETISPFNVIGRALESSTDAGIKLVNCAVRTNN